MHFITGNVVEPDSIKFSENKIEVCRGTNVAITVSDTTGIPSISELSTGIDCVGSGCTINDIQSRQRYRVSSSDGKDKDTIQIRIAD